MTTNEFIFQIINSRKPSNLQTFQLNNFNHNGLNEEKTKQMVSAIDSFKMIKISLENYLKGDVNSYKAIAEQLIVLFFDDKKDGKEEPLIYRIHPDIKLLAFNEIKFEGRSSDPISFAILPYAIEERRKGVIDASLDINLSYSYLSREEWIKQTIVPPDLNVENLILSGAEHEEGSDIGDGENGRLKFMKLHSHTNGGANVYFIIALAHYVLELANQIVPIWFQYKIKQEKEYIKEQQKNRQHKDLLN